MGKNKDISRLKKVIENHYLAHDVRIQLSACAQTERGERFIFDVRLHAGTKERAIFDRAGDIQTALGLPLFQPFKEGLLIRIAVSEQSISKNALYGILCNPVFYNSRQHLPLALGYDMRGEACIVDLAEQPHLLIAGSSGAGKTVALLSIVVSLLVRHTVNAVSLVLVNTGTNDFDIFNDNHLLSAPIVKDAETGAKVMAALAEEMERRIELSHVALLETPAIVCIIDEFTSLISSTNEKKTIALLTDAISALLRRGRHAKIHLIIAAQDPTNDNMKIELGNITGRIALRCAKAQNSITILGRSGAEKLVGKGSMLLKTSCRTEAQHLLGAYISHEDIHRILEALSARQNIHKDRFILRETSIWTGPGSDNRPVNLNEKRERDAEMVRIVLWTLGRDSVSANQIQGTFQMGGRAADIISAMTDMKIVSEKRAKLSRMVLPKTPQDIQHEVQEWLSENGISPEDVQSAFESRNT